MNRFHGKSYRAYVLGFTIATTAVLSAQEATDDDEIIELSPFEVTDGSSIGYQARETLAGSRLRTDLRDVANAVQVINQEFLQDTGSTDSESLLVYTTNTEVGGIQGNFANTGDSGNPTDTTQRIQPQNNTRVRGLDSADNTRNFFLTSIPWDGYNVERVDIQRGANAVLFGIGSPAGIINTDLIKPLNFNQGKVEFRVGSYGSLRANFDLNRVIVDDLLSVRVAGVHKDTKFRQEPAFEDDQRLYAALRLTPEFLGERNDTRFDFSFETGSIDANRPRILPPVDKITPWFNSSINPGAGVLYDPRTITLGDYDEWVSLGRPATYGAASRNMESEADGIFSNITPQFGGDNPNGTYNPWVDARGADWFDGPIFIFPNPREAYFTRAMPGQFISNMPAGGPTGGQFNPWNGIPSYATYANRARLPGYEIGAYKDKVLTDPSIFNFYENLLDGPTKYENEDFETFNAALSQTFLDNTFGFELVYDHQEYSRENSESILGGGGYAIAMDIMTHYADGTPNPNAGRPLVGSRSGGGGSYDSEADTLRLTAFAQFDFANVMDSERFITRLLGRHVITGLLASTENDERRRSWERYATDDNYVGNDGHITGAGRQIATANYIGPNLVGRSDARGLNLQRIQALRNPASTTMPIWDWAVANPGAEVDDLDRYVGWRNFPLGVWNAETGDRGQLYTGGGTTESITKTDSLVFVWQGYLLDGLIVPTVSWREDEQVFRGTGVAPGNVIGQDIFDHPEWYIPGSAEDAPEGGNRNYNSEKDDNVSWGVVVHTPRFIRDQLPAGLNFSLFYNDSSNFRPQSGRVDAFGRSVASPSGETKDYGFTVGAMDDRFVLKVNWYESNVTNATVSGVLGGNYLVGYSDAWGAMFAHQARIATEGNAPFGSFNQDYWEDNPDAFLAYQPAPGQTHQEALDQQMASVNALIANPPPVAFQDAWGANIQDWLNSGPQNWFNVTEPNGMVVTGDTESEGIEFEFSAQITRNWNITMNAAKTKATRSNLAAGLASFVEERYAFWQGPAGDVRFWNGAYGGETLRSKFEAEFYGNYTLQRLLEGSNVPENRKWRFNLVTNYSFTEGPLEGLNIGGSYRWQDKIVIGYPLNSASDGYNIDNPIYGPTEHSVDAWIGYQRPINEHIDWRIQLNVRNLMNDDDLIPITANPDGSGAAYRIPDERTWFITNTFMF